MAQFTLNREDFKFLEDDKYCTKTNKFSLHGYRTFAKCVYVYDGDTVHIIFKMPNGNECYKWVIRLIGIDTPEMKSKNANEKKKANEARDYLRGLILNKLIIVECLEFDKYGRLLGNLFLEGDSISLSQKMITAGFAKAYDGGHKDGWVELDEE
jgi:micrococcal nuclease